MGPKIWQAWHAVAAGAVTADDIAAATASTPGRVGALLRRLVDEGHISLHGGKKDRTYTLIEEPPAVFPGKAKVLVRDMTKRTCMNVYCRKVFWTPEDYRMCPNCRKRATGRSWTSGIT